MTETENNVTETTNEFQADEQELGNAPADADAGAPEVEASGSTEASAPAAPSAEDEPPADDSSEGGVAFTHQGSEGP